MSEGRIIVPVVAVWHGHKAKYKTHNEINPATGELRVELIHEILEPGRVVEVPTEMADDLFRRSIGRDPLVREPTELEMALWESAGRYSIL